MNAHVDPNAQHAAYSPSSASRWTVCTASATAIARLGEQRSGEAAIAGTEAHAEIERCLANPDAPLPVDDDHPAAFGVALFLDYVRQLPPGKMWVEQRVALTDQIWGRCDVAHWHPDTATLTIIDFKNGVVDVDVVENEQLRIYGAASISTHRLPAKWIRTVIVQPNSFMPGALRVKQAVESAESLFAFASAVAAIPLGPLTFVAGEACKYCPMFGRCPASQDVLLKLNVMLANPADDVPADQVSLFLATKKPVADWFASLEKAATKKALTGSVPDGMKLVTAQRHLAWRDEAAARAAILEQFGADALDPPTPAQAKKIGLSEEQVALLAERPIGSPALAFASDRRPDWTPKSAADMFAGVPGVTA